MRKLLIKTLILFLIMVGFECQSQDISKDSDLSKKHIVGFQVNPHISSRSFKYPYPDQYVFALRYGFLITSKISLGPEFSCNYFKDEISTAYSLSAGIFLRYTFMEKKAILPFIESSVFYQIGKTKITNEDYVYDDDTYYDNTFVYYFAPGITVNLWKNIITLDLMVKASTVKLFFGNNIVPSYKLQFNF